VIDSNLQVGYENVSHNRGYLEVWLPVFVDPDDGSDENTHSYVSNLN
jgi:hypothetical protein